MRSRSEVVGKSPRFCNRIASLAELPELNVALFAFLLNFPWEFLQAPFFKGMATAPHWAATKHCTVAALGDAGLTLIVYWIISACMRSRQWIRTLEGRATAGFVLCMLALNVGSEHLAMNVFGRWAYARTMPIVPLIRVGLLPLLQWALLPPVALWFVRRQLK